MLKKIFFAMTFLLINSINPTLAKDVPNQYVTNQKSADSLCGTTCYNTLTHQRYQGKWSDKTCKCANFVKVYKEQTGGSNSQALDKMCKLECSLKKMDFFDHELAGISNTTICYCLDYN